MLHLLISLASSAGHEKSLLVILITCFSRNLGVFVLKFHQLQRNAFLWSSQNPENRITSVLLFTSLSRSKFFLSFFLNLKNNFVCKWKIMQKYDNLQQKKRDPGFVVAWLFLLPGLSLIEEWLAHSLEIATNELQGMNLLMRSTISNNGGGGQLTNWLIISQ